MVEEAPLAPDVPVVMQVSRWDQLKDPLGVLGAFLPGMAAGQWVLRGHQAVRQRAADHTLWLEIALGPGGPRDAADSGPDRFVSAPAMTRYHRPGCLAAAGKPFTLDARAGHERAGRRPCEMCRP